MAPSIEEYASSIEAVFEVLRAEDSLHRWLIAAYHRAA